MVWMSQFNGILKQFFGTHHHNMEIIIKIYSCSTLWVWVYYDFTPLKHQDTNLSNLFLGESFALRAIHLHINDVHELLKYRRSLNIILLFILFALFHLLFPSLSHPPPLLHPTPALLSHTSTLMLCKKKCQ